jgi:hypothetical protein
MPSYCQQCREERVANKGDLCSMCERENKMTPEEKADRDAFMARFFSNRPVSNVVAPTDPDSRRRPGPKATGPERHFVYERVYNLRKDGLSFGEIAQRIWDVPSKRNLASAHYQRAIKLGFPPIKPSGK